MTRDTEARGRTRDLREHAGEIARAGGRAPSLHNAQPWAFRVGPAEVEVYADLGRRVPVADPDDRQLFLGVGAAAGPARPADAAVTRALYGQLEHRRTVRGPFTDDAVPVPLQVRLAEVARRECV